MGSLGVEAGEDLEGGGEIPGGERVVGLLDQGGGWRGLDVWVGEVLRGQRECEAGGGDAGGETKCGGKGFGHIRRGLKTKARHGAGSRC